MPRASSARSALAGLLVVLAGAATARAQEGSGKPRSQPERKRRELLDELGLEKRKSRPAPPPAGTSPGAGATPPASPAEPPADDQPQPTGGSGKIAGGGAPSFRRVVHPALMASCAACHRAGGPAATRLVLSGDPALDHPVVVRLVVVRDPAMSPLLAKVSGQPHGGGAPWPPDSAPYGHLRAWVARGARLDTAAGVESAASPASPSSAPRPPMAPLVPAVPPSSARANEAQAARPPESQVAAPAPAATISENTFAATVHPILMGACATCHSPTGPAGRSGLVLTGVAAADEAAARAFVDPSNPERSPLMTKAAGEVHGGGTILMRGEARYERLLAWATPSAATPPPPGPVVVAPLPPVAPPPGRPARAVLSQHGGHGPHGGIDLPFGFLLNGRFDLDYERRDFTGNPFVADGANALRSYHHFLFLSRAGVDDPCGLSVEILTLQFWEAHCRVVPAAHGTQVSVAGGKIVVPFGADPLYHQSYGGLAGFDQRTVPVIWAVEGFAGHLVHQRGGLVLTDDLFVVRGYALAHADGVLDLQNDFSPLDDARLGWGNRVGAAWMGLSAWYSAYYNPLGFGRHLFMQAIDVTVWRLRGVPVLGRFTFGGGLLRADVAGGDDAGAGGPGKDYYHFASYLQLRGYVTDWLYAQYRQGLHTFDNRRGVILDRSRLTSADGSSHNFGIVVRYRGLTGGVFYFVNLEKADEIPDDLLRVSVTYEF